MRPFAQCALAMFLGSGVAHGADWSLAGEAGAGYDDNANNWEVPAEQVDSSFGFATATLIGTLHRAPKARLQARFGLGGEHWEAAEGLSFARASAGLRHAVRAGAEFFAPTMISSATVAHSEFDSDMRDGQDLRLSLALLQQLSTEVAGRLTVASTWRNGRHDVFDLQTQSLGAHLEWRPRSMVALFGGWQLQVGDLVSSAPEGRGMAALASAQEIDDAYTERPRLKAYRIDARTHLATLGANLGLSRQVSLETRIQRAEAKTFGNRRYERWIATGSVLARF